MKNRVPWVIQKMTNNGRSFALPISHIIPHKKNQWAKYLEVASYILLSLYSFPEVTSVDESNDDLDSLHTVTVNPSKRLIGRESSFCSEQRKQKLYFHILLKFPEEVDKFCYDLWRGKTLRI